jgi:hypothetical protein
MNTTEALKLVGGLSKPSKMPGWANTSTVVSGEGRTCPAPDQDNECKDCRACWDKSVPNVAYGKH